MFRKILYQVHVLTNGDTIILPLVLHGCDTWSLTLREEYKLHMLKKKVLRNIFGPKKKQKNKMRNVR
jgi:hypothetical protein